MIVFKILDGLLVLRVILGARRQLAIAHGSDFAAQRLLADGHAKLLPKPLRQIAQTPANNPVEIGCRTALNGLRQGRTLLIVQPRLRAGSLAVHKAFRAALVEADDPVANNLERHIAEKHQNANRHHRSRRVPTTGAPGLHPSSAGPAAAKLHYRNPSVKKFLAASNTSGSHQRLRFTASRKGKRVEVCELPYNSSGVNIHATNPPRFAVRSTDIFAEV